MFLNFRPSDINIARDGSIRFKICQPATFSNICDNVESAYIIWKYSNNKNCKVLSGNDTSLKKSDFFGKNFIMYSRFYN
jgi:hypothetical protein